MSRSVWPASSPGRTARHASRHISTLVSIAIGLLMLYNFLPVMIRMSPHEQSQSIIHSTEAEAAAYSLQPAGRDRLRVMLPLATNGEHRRLTYDTATHGRPITRRICQPAAIFFGSGGSARTCAQREGCLGGICSVIVKSDARDVIV